MRRLLLIFFLSIGFGVSSNAVDTPDAKAILKTYSKDLKKLTPKPHLVNGYLFLLCRRVSDEEILKIQKEQTGPHFLTHVDIYTDKAGAEALKAGKAKLPVGTVIVKEKSKKAEYPISLGKEGGVGKEGIGGMIKREPGYDPENGDWEYFYSDKDGKVTSGKMKNCIECHKKAAEKDYVFRTWLKPVLKADKEEKKP